jgi:hypothetical protein
MIVPLLLAVAGGVVYHTGAKSIPKDLAPGLVLTVAYAMALVISVGAYLALGLVVFNEGVSLRRNPLVPVENLVVRD